MIKRPDFKNKVIAQSNNKANFLKRPVFLNGVIIKALNKKNITASNKANVRQEMNFENGVIVKFDGLVIKDKIIVKALNIANIIVHVTKRPNSKYMVIAKVWSVLNFVATDYHADNFFSCKLINILANLLDNLSHISIYNFDNIHAFYY